MAKQTGKYSEQLFLIEDYEYWLRMGTITKMHHIPEPLYFYRKHANTLTATRQQEILKAKRQLKKMYQGKYHISATIQPISDLYDCFIGQRNMRAALKFLAIIFKNPVITLRYIAQNLRRLW